MVVMEAHGVLYIKMADKLWLTNNGDLYLRNKLIDLLG